MLRSWGIALCLFITSTVYGATESVMSLLDNRFRVDPTIEQITFVVYRATASQPVVLVRPDGKKYFAWKQYPNVRWYQESSMDIISIDDPMPGPWQAVGKVTPKNNVKLISHLALSTDPLPLRLYQGEQIKFNARLTSDGEPLVLRDFLERVNLRITLTKYVEDEASLVKEARPIPLVLGEFSDDGQGYDAYAGDGVFTVRFTVDVEPGKYRARVVSGNGVFLRALEQEVLVYPSPISETFIQARVISNEHIVNVAGEPGMIEPGSLMLHVTHTAPDEYVYDVQGQASAGAEKVQVTIPNSGEYGQFAWQGEVFATEANSKRPLNFAISEQTYSVVKPIDLAKVRQQKEAQLAEQRRLEEQQAMLAAREAARQRSLLMIVVGNVIAIIVGIVGWVVWSKWQARKRALPEMQLSTKK